MLTVIKEVYNYNNINKTYYECKCDCGNICYKAKNTFKKYQSYSCGCTRKPIHKIKESEDMIGKKYGKLEVKKILPNYKNGNTYCECICECGKAKIALRTNILRGYTQSCGCLEKESRFVRSHYKDLTGQKFGHLEVIKLSDVKYSNGSVGWLCKCDCGKEIIIRSSSLLRGHTRSCGCNKISKYEEYIEEILDNYFIEYKREYRFNDCKNHFQLPFDFYIDNYKGKKYCIEYQGLQHYEPIEHFGGKDKLLAVQNNDRIKKEYCEKHGINLIVISHKESKDEIKKELLDILEPVTTTVA